RRSGLEEALSSPPFSKLETRDRAFARALAMAALRHLGPIDRALAERLEREPPERVRHILRLGAAQAFWLDVPDFAAVSTSVELAQASKASRPFKGLVNAVLRRLIAQEPPPSDPEALAPAWLYARWRAAYGEEADAIAAKIAQEPATDLTLRGEPPEGLEGELLSGGSFRVAQKGDITAWPGYAEGSWWVQDAAAAVPARLLEVKAGESALDLCAAPGGKTLQLAAAGAHVTALDRSAARLRRLKENLERTGLAAEIVVADAEAWEDARTFDAVLLDAPCASTGTFRRNPDVLWALRPGDIAKLAQVQARLLDSAARRVKSGGRLVHCVCSLEPEEGEAQVGPFLRRNPDFQLVPIQPGDGGAPAASARDGLLRILPHHLPGGLDGFFAARFARL
ncbi:MAG TPA: RsmB/NOP family class I SAM-dependent RNA methyltransferase, partial [Caulobacteraceae bacterium]|nr:RsmB/NOP family class I SAM-dependent RNA methyltransferase [Caulobacteraceae bacterium]